MRKVQPAQVCLYRRGPQSVLPFIHCMIDPGIDDGLMIYLGVGDGIRETEAYASTCAGADKAVLRAGVECIFPVYEFRVKDHVALLWATCLQIGQSFPLNEVFGPGDAALCDGG